MSSLVEARELAEYTQMLRRDFHRHPELGFQEFRTAGIIARELGQLGLEVHTGIAKTGVIGIIEGGLPGPVVLLRFDMDALPVQEETGVEYASQTAGVMHACGHDGHIAIGLTVARMLFEKRKTLSGSFVLVFQPAEEGLGGAEEMIAAGVLVNPRPDYCLALHLWNEVPVGRLAIKPGPLMSSSEIFTIRLVGKGGHGALPNQTIDPIAACGQIITAMQTIVARNVSPLDAAVISITRLKAGEAFNVIPPFAEMFGTIRTFRKEVREVLLARFRTLVEHVSAGMGCTAEITLQELTPAVVNDPQVSQWVREAVLDQLPDDQIDDHYQTMVSEDMAFFMEQIPGCYFLVGSANPKGGVSYGHHHPKFDIEEEALTHAAAAMAAAAERIGRSGHHN